MSEFEQRRYDLDWLRIGRGGVRHPRVSRAARERAQVHAGGKQHLIRESLAGFIAQLDPGHFLRVHRSHVVRLGFIAELRPLFHGDYELVLRDGRTLPLSRRYKALLPESIRERL